MWVCGGAGVGGSVRCLAFSPGGTIENSPGLRPGFRSDEKRLFLVPEGRLRTPNRVFHFE